MDFTWVLGCINTNWVLHGLGVYCGNAIKLWPVQLLQYIQIFPVNFNYSARTALYVYVFKKKPKKQQKQKNSMVILKETILQNNHGTWLVSKQYPELIKTNHFSSNATHSCLNTTIFSACNCQILSSHDLHTCFWQWSATLSILPQKLAWQKWPRRTPDASEKCPLHSYMKTDTELLLIYWTSGIKEKTKCVRVCVCPPPSILAFLDV